MADARRYALAAQLDIEQILAEAQHRWLRPAEICEILRNYTKFKIATEPGNRPPNGSLFLFDRKVLRYFRKDGHNWRKKKDGKTVKEAHERLKAGSIDVLHCYYAHGEDNENFQRRSYWLLEEELSNIVLVHYREVKGSRTSANRTRVVETTPNSLESEENISTTSEVNNSVSSNFRSYNYPVASQTTENSAQASEYEDAESAYSYQSTSGYSPVLNLQPSVIPKTEDPLSMPYYPVPLSNDYNGKSLANPDMSFITLMQGDKNANNIDGSLAYAFENYNAGIQPASYQPTHLSTQSYNTGFDKMQEFRGNPTWQLDAGYNNQEVSYAEIFNSLEMTNAIDQHPKPIAQGNLELHSTKEDDGTFQKTNVEGNLNPDEKSGSLKPPYLEGFMKEGLKKLDSFDRWMSKELGDVKETQTQSTSGTYWEAVESENGVDDSIISPQVHLDSYVLGPSLSQDQLFTITDFSPNWAYAGSEIKVLVTGRFLRSQQELQHCEWACMFGELEVPAEVVADGVLRCHTPDHKSGRVHFYVTCSNRLACSEVREFEFKNNQDMDGSDVISGDNSNETLLHTRFMKLLSLGSGNTQNFVDSVNDPELMSQLSSLIQDDNSEWDQMLKFSSEDEFSSEKAKSQLFEKLLKEKLYSWILHKVAEGGKGASVLDEEGQGVLHFAGALGYDWAIQPVVAAGVSINFRDVNGWTALHWAACCGRERTVAFLISQGAAAGALTDPSPRYPSGRTPADLASSNGDKGIAGYCAEAALSAHLELLKLKDANNDGDASGSKAVQTVTERTPTPLSYGDMPQGLSLKDSLAAVCNATQAAARIHQVFRVQSFQKKQLKEHGGSEFGLSNERALSLLAVKTTKTGQHDEPVHSAAVRIQNKFRSWKGRKDFLIMRQRVVKIQAHVRGHQVRKNYRKIVWSVGILDKVILRWRRKGSGLRGFKPEPIAEGSSSNSSTIEAKPVLEEEDDFFKEGRKQTEQRLQKALARVKSMAQYPEARDQYRRLLNVVNDMQESKAVYEKALDSSEETMYFDDDLIDIDALLGDDDAFMTI
ncbi:calmodulin-binding transcription activator 3-like [Rutidosis leptorrhynchoides]|uniref:calmodulin-binding transcription activator 3-like n=1 Tax=Rutidosis leptorrhynchoides TaxID=125765 RepID=UPI003A99598D